MKFKSHFYFEEKDRVTEAEKALEPLPGSKITFFKNGECLGTAFTDVFAVSINYVNYKYQSTITSEQSDNHFGCLK